MATNDGRAARPLAAEADGNAAGRNGGRGVTALPRRDKGISNPRLEKVFTEEPCHIRVAL